MNTQYSSIGPRLLQHAKSKRNALVTDDSEVSYEEFFTWVSTIKAFLDRLNQPIIGVVADRHKPEVYAALVACLISGRTYVPIPRDNPKARNQNIVRQTRISTIISIGEFDQSFADCSNYEPLKDESVRSVNVPIAPDVSVETNAYVLFTSGSTGAPKGVPITHANLESFVSAVLDDESLGFASGDRYMQMFELTFDLSVMMYLLPLLLGKTICLVRAKGNVALNVLNAIDRLDIDTTLMVPSVIGFTQGLLNRLEFSNLRLSMFCGEALRASHLIPWRKCSPNARIYNLYGPTEATIFATMHECTTERHDEYAHNDIVSIGTPIKNMSARIVDSTGADVADGTRGQLLLFGPQLMDGYWGNKPEGSQVFWESGYKTGDVCFRREGLIYFVGRADKQVKVGGHRIELGDVDLGIRKYLPTGSDIRVLSVEEEAGARLILFGQQLSSEAWDELAIKAKENLPSYMFPSEHILLDAFPLNRSGKVDNKALLELYRNSDGQ